MFCPTPPKKKQLVMLLVLCYKSVLHTLLGVAPQLVSTERVWCPYLLPGGGGGG